MAGFPTIDTSLTQRDLGALLRQRIRLLSDPSFGQDEEDFTLLSRIKAAMPVAKGNITRERNLQLGGVDTAPILEPTEPGDEPSFLGRLLGAFETVDEPVRRYGLGGLLEAFGRVPRGELTGRDEAVRGRDIIQGARGTLGEEPDWVDEALGFGTEVLASPFTYLTGGVGAGTKLLRGGKTVATLNRVGTQALKERAGTLLSRLTRTGTRKGIDAGGNKFLPQAMEMASREFTEKFAKGALPEAMLDKGGLKFFRQTLVPGESFRQTAKFVADLPVMREFVAAAKPHWDSVVNIFKPPIRGVSDYSNLLRFNAVVNGQTASGIKLGFGAAGRFADDKPARKALSLAMERLKGVDAELAASGIKYPGAFVLEAGEKVGRVPNLPARVAAHFENPAVRKAYLAEIKKSGLFAADAADDALNAIRDYNKMYTQVWQDLNDHGVTINEFLEQWVPHIAEYRGSASAIRQLPPSGFAKMDVPGRGQHRVIDTIEQFQAIMKQLGVKGEVKADISELYAMYHRSAWTAIAKKELFRDSAKLAKQEYNAALKARLGAKLYTLKERGQIEQDMARRTAEFIEGMATQSNAPKLFGKGLVRTEAATALRQKEAGGAWNALRPMAQEHSQAKQALRHLLDRKKQGFTVTKEEIKDARLAVKEAKDLAAPFRKEFRDRARNRGLRALGGMESIANVQNGWRTFQMGDDMVTAPETIVRALENIARVNTSPDEIKSAVGLFRKMNNFFRRNVTTWWPSFHVRNLYSDVQNGMYDAGLAAIGPAHGKAISIMLNKKGFLADGTTSFSNVREWFEKLGGMSYDIGRRDVVTSLNQMIKDASKIGKVNPLTVYRKYIEKSGVAIENHTKMLLFVHNLERGLAPEQALQRALKFTLDYKTASAADRKIREIIPFWTFMKKNLAFQAERFVTHPGQQSATIRGLKAMEDFIPRAMGVAPLTEEERQALPDFVKENLAIPFYRGADSTVGLFTNLDLRIQALNELFALPGGFTWESLMRTVQKNAASVTPLIKNMGEMVANYDVFFGAPLRGGEFVDERTGEVKRPYTRQRDLPLIFSAIPGYNVVDTKQGPMIDANPDVRKIIEATGLGRFLSEANKFGRFGEAIQGGEARPIAGSLIDMFSGGKLREENTKELQAREWLNRISGRNRVMRFAQMEQRQ